MTLAKISLAFFSRALFRKNGCQAYWNIETTSIMKMPSLWPVW